MNRIRPRTTARRSQAAGAGKTCATRFAAARLSAALLLYALIVAALPALAAAARRHPGEDVPLIPRDVLFSDPDRTSVQISPDGRWISFLAPSNGVLNVWVAPATTPMPRRPSPTPATGDCRLQLDLSRFAPDLRARYRRRRKLEALPPRCDHRRKRPLTPESGVNAQIVAISPKHPQEIVVGLNDRLPEWHDLYRVNLRTGERALLHENEGMLRYLLDDDYHVRFAATMTPDGGMFILAAAEEGWQPFLQISTEDAITTGRFAWTPLAPSSTPWTARPRDRRTGGPGPGDGRQTGDLRGP